MPESLQLYKAHCLLAVYFICLQICRIESCQPAVPTNTIVHGTKTKLTRIAAKADLVQMRHMQLAMGEREEGSGLDNDEFGEEEGTEAEQALFRNAIIETSNMLLQNQSNVTEQHQKLEEEQEAKKAYTPQKSETMLGRDITQQHPKSVGENEAKQTAILLQTSQMLSSSNATNHGKESEILEAESEEDDENSVPETREDNKNRNSSVLMAVTVQPDGGVKMTKNSSSDEGAEDKPIELPDYELLTMGNSGEAGGNKELIKIPEIEVKKVEVERNEIVDEPSRDTDRFCDTAMVRLETIYPWDEAKVAHYETLIKREMLLLEQFTGTRLKNLGTVSKHTIMQTSQTKDVYGEYYFVNRYTGTCEELQTFVRRAVSWSRDIPRATFTCRCQDPVEIYKVTT